MTLMTRAGTTLLAIIPMLGMLAAGAPATELPRGASAAPVRTGCESLGPDFHKVEGSETCIRVSGSARVEATIRSGGGSGFLTWPPRR